MEYGITKELTTEDERLWENISYKRLKEIIKMPNVRVVNYSIDTNSFGTFKFITIDYNNSKDRITFYGLGFHEYKDSYVHSIFKFYTSYKHSDDIEKILNKSDILQNLEEEYELLKEDVISHKQSREGEEFQLIAEMTDDDSAISMINY